MRRCECRGANRVYSEEAGRCKRVNPCRANSTICGAHGKCHMTRAGFRCQCEEGFRQADEQSACKDIDECLEVRILDYLSTGGQEFMGSKVQCLFCS